MKFLLIIFYQWESQGVTHHRFARLNLVDLAGSERYDLKSCDVQFFIGKCRVLISKISMTGESQFLFICLVVQEKEREKKEKERKLDQ